MGDAFVAVTELTVPPAGEERVYLRMTVRGVAVNSDLRVAVRFATNDPDWPERTIIAKVVRVWGGTTHSPESVNFGTVLVGTTAERIVHLWDTSNPPRRIDRVVSSRPDEVGVKLLPPDDGEPPPYRIRPRCIGRLLITAKSDAKSTIDAAVSVYAKDDGDRHDDIRVLGRVTESHIFSPAAIALPRRADAGAVHTMQCICRSHDNSSFAVLSLVQPKGITLSCSTGIDAPFHTIGVAVDPAMKPGHYSAFLEVRTAAGTRRLELPIEVDHDAPKN